MYVRSSRPRLFLIASLLAGCAVSLSGRAAWAQDEGQGGNPLRALPPRPPSAQQPGETGQTPVPAQEQSPINPIQGITPGADRLPATPPTTQQNAGNPGGTSSEGRQPPSHPQGAGNQSTVSSPVTGPPRRAHVSWSRDELLVQADNSSLNQILRDIAAATGMKITGGVSDERVFGNYGPAPAAEVLSKLLDGTASNVLLHESESDGVTPATVTELVLSARGGSAATIQPAQETTSEATPVEATENNDNNTERAQEPPPAGNPMRNGADGPGAASSEFLGNQTGANGAKTPQEIYDQLMREQQERSQQPQTPQPAPE